MQSSHIMAIIIVAMVMFASVMRSRYRFDRKEQRALAREDDAETKRLREEVKMLKDRLAVLERITVEKENSLEREIEALRDR